MQAISNRSMNLICTVRFERRLPQHVSAKFSYRWLGAIWAFHYRLLSKMIPPAVDAQLVQTWLSKNHERGESRTGSGRKAILGTVTCMTKKLRPRISTKPRVCKATPTCHVSHIFDCQALPENLDPTVARRYGKGHQLVCHPTTSFVAP